MRPDIEQRSDDDLIAGIASGAADAFAALFRRRQKEVYRFALHVTGSTAMAEDVTQDVFVVVMRDARRYEAGRSTVAAWLCGIARNCARQRLDREARLESLDADPPNGDRNEGLMQAAETDPVSELARIERIAQLRRAVLALPLRYREVVVLCDLQELSYAEAADVLGCAIGTVRSRLHRARTLLGMKMAAAESRESDGTRPMMTESEGARPSKDTRIVIGPPRRTQRRCLA